MRLTQGVSCQFPCVVSEARAGALRLIKSDAKTPRGPRPGHNVPMRAFLPRPESGRVFTARQLVRNTDVTPAGRLRFDALARYLQLAAEDDLVDAGWSEPYGWLLRKITVTVREFPRLGGRVELHTFCSGTGPRWAERTTTVAGPEGDLVQATAVWAAISLATPPWPAPGRPPAQSRSWSARPSAARFPSRTWPARPGCPAAGTHARSP